MSFTVNVPKIGPVEVPLTTKNFKKSDGGLFGLVAFVIIGGTLLLMFAK
jgi:hypothetical protein